MIWSTLQEISPIPCLPESESFHVSIVITHRCIPVRRPVEVEVNKLFQVSSDNLISVHKYDLFQIHREEDVEEQDLVCPNDTLLFFLGLKPRWPFVCHEFVLETIGFCHMWDEFLSWIMIRINYGG
jgi:hypothetical protein